MALRTMNHSDILGAGREEPVVGVGKAVHVGENAAPWDQPIPEKSRALAGTTSEQKRYGYNRYSMRG